MELPTVEMVGHASAVLVFTAVAYFTWQYRTNLRRNVQHSRFLYRLILATGVVFALINLARLYTLVVPGISSGTAAWIDLLSEYPSTIAQSVIIFYLLANKIIIERSGRPRRVLAIGAHPDDIDVGVGITLARLQASGSHVTGLVLAPGQPENAGQPPAWQAGDFLGLDDLRLLAFESGSLRDQPQALEQAVWQAIQDFQPDLVFTHSLHDQNADHRAVNAATLTAGQYLRAILCYEGHSPTADFCPALYVNAGEYVSVKAEALERRQGTRPKPYLNPESIRGQLAYRGAEARVEYAEGFEVVRLVSSLLVDL
jgi:LmbE family N-acetylglucosaminyl deacetylase